MNPPKPIALKLVQGTARPDRDAAKNADLEKADATIQPPTSLDVTGKAKWREMVKQYADAGILDKVDLIGLENLCMSYQRGRTYRREEQRAEKEAKRFRLAAEAMLELGDVDRAKINFEQATHWESARKAAMANQRREAAATRQYLQDYGATPRSKRGLPAGKVTADDPLTKLLANQGKRKTS